MDNAPTRKELSHERIVDAAARAIRQRGYAGVGVADVMQEAGLTHGGFYAHFASRDALLVAALERAARTSAAGITRRAESSVGSGISPFRALVDNYLDDALLEHVDGGCPVAALCSEMPRQAPDVREASSVRVKALLRYVERSLPAGVPVEQAGVVAATMIGTLQLARAVGDRQHGRALLAATRRSLIDQYDVR